MLKEYVRDRRTNQLKGCVVAIKENDKVAIGHSLCCPKDKFDKQFATKLAVERAKKVLDGRETEIPQSVSATHTKMFHRASKFFKGHVIEH